MKAITESHLDHGLTESQVEFILKIEVPAGTVTVKTIELPENLGTVPCALYGPKMGDDPIDEDDVTYKVRGNRKGESRVVNLPMRPTRVVTFVAGPHNGEEGVLYTAFGGPSSPREPFEFDDHMSEEAREPLNFWSEHALSAEGSGE